MSELHYQRILVKLSGEALTGKSSSGIDPKILESIAQKVKEVRELGVEVAVVIGGGNLFRGEELSHSGLSRITGDHMGMLATLMNALAMRDVFERFGLSCAIHSAIPMSGVVDHFDRRKAMTCLKEGRVVIFAGGTGNPLVTTDTAASLRAIEIGADCLLKATQVDGIYSADPKKHADAKRYDNLTFDEVLTQELGVMDLSAFCQCRDMGMPIRIFDIHHPQGLKDIVLGKPIGTLVS